MSGIIGKFFLVPLAVQGTSGRLSEDHLLCRSAMDVEDTSSRVGSPAEQVEQEFSVFSRDDLPRGTSCSDEDIDHVSSSTCRSSGSAGVLSPPKRTSTTPATTSTPATRTSECRGASSSAILLHEPAPLVGGLYLFDTLASADAFLGSGFYKSVSSQFPWTDVEVQRFAIERGVAPPPPQHVEEASSSDIDIIGDFEDEEFFTPESTPASGAGMSSSCKGGWKFPLSPRSPGVMAKPGLGRDGTALRDVWSYAVGDGWGGAGI